MVLKLHDGDMRVARRIVVAATAALVLIAAGGVHSRASASSTGPGPVVASVDPPRGQGATNRKVTVRGFNFVPGAKLSFPGVGVSVVSTNFVSAAKLISHITVAQDAPPGIRGATVTNPDGKAGTCEACFTVNPGPKPASTSPSSGARGKTLMVKVLGSNFQDPARVRFGKGIMVNSVVFVGAGELDVTIAIDGSAKLGPRDVKVVNVADGGVGTCSACFAVTP